MIKKQLFRFIVIGVVGTTIDWILYISLLEVFPTSLAKSLSFIVASIIGFIFNKVWTFNDTNSAKVQIVKYSILYTSTLLVNIIVNYCVLIIFPSEYFLAFFIATGVHTIVNFCGQKYWVFKSSIF